MKTKLLTRDQFREGVFSRDNHKCVICGAEGQDAHHIIERRLWTNGGYYLDNGATLCGEHHLLAESTELTCEEIRTAAGINTTMIPEHLYSDNNYRYDKWGNIILPNETRLVGKLFHDESVQKIISPVLDQFTQWVKYPRTYHVPWSQDGRKDDKYLQSMSNFEGRHVVVTEKMDGENTTMYSNHIHARSINSGTHPTRKWVKGLWGRIAWEIPEGWRICGENMYAKHTVSYNDLASYFLVFSIWDEMNNCLSWDETLEYCDILGLNTVPVLYTGEYDEKLIQEKFTYDGISKEGWVIRNAELFHYKDFRSNIAKCVGKDFVLPHGHWASKKTETNQLK